MPASFVSELLVVSGRPVVLAVANLTSGLQTVACCLFVAVFLGGLHTVGSVVLHDPEELPCVQLIFSIP